MFPAKRVKTNFWYTRNRLVVSGLRGKQDVPNNLYAQEFFQRLLLQSVFDRVLESGEIAEPAYGFEDISTELNTVATSVPLGEIEEICARKGDLVEFLSQHPLSNRVKSLLL